MKIECVVQEITEVKTEKAGETIIKYRYKLATSDDAVIYIASYRKLDLARDDELILAQVKHQKKIGGEIE